MKKYIFFGFILILIAFAYLLYDEKSYNPLSDSDFKNIFRESIGIKKVCSKDYLGLSSSGEVFDIYLYDTKGATINANFPNENNWEHKIFTADTEIGKWSKTPIASESKRLLNFTLTINDFEKEKCFRSFNKNLNDPDNYYCFIHIDELEQYFFLFSPENEKLYYIRRRGF